MTDIVGCRFGRLKVVEFSYKKNHHSYYLCQCECGEMKTIRRDALTRGKVKSCGCLQREYQQKISSMRPVHITHGMSNTRLYRIWCGMKKRCYNPKHKNYNSYGGRGISVCDEWLNNFSLFCEWAMEHGYTDILTIDRIDVNGNYEPCNCRWVTWAEQARNKRNTKEADHERKDQSIIYR